MKKSIIKVVVLIILVATISSVSACSFYSYGDSYSDIAALQVALSEEGLELLYPADSGTDADNYLSNIDSQTSQTLGYKIYYFGTPYYIAVYGYAGEADGVISTLESEVESVGTLDTTKGTVALYLGDYHGETMYFIGVINIDGNHYEVRVTANKDMANGEYTNAIFEDNEHYELAQSALKEIVEGLNDPTI